MNKNKNIEEIVYHNKLLAILVKNEFEETGIHFLTPPDFSQQLAYMNHPKGHKIEPHIHGICERNIKNTLEVLMIKKGSLRVDFYNETQMYLKSVLLSSGDIILLCSGGHGFEVLEEVTMIEVKQGPYFTDLDKIRFVSIENSKIRI